VRSASCFMAPPLRLKLYWYSFFLQSNQRNALSIVEGAAPTNVLVTSTLKVEAPVNTRLCMLHPTCATSDPYHAHTIVPGSSESALPSLLQMVRFLVMRGASLLATDIHGRVPRQLAHAHR
jgi:hypothetical protein